MPRKKKPSTTTANEAEKKRTVVHTKRKEITDDEGWTHVIDSPNRRGKVEGLKGTPLRHGGDFVRDGVSYITRTLEEVQQEFEHWKKQWEASSACSELQTLLPDREEAKRERTSNVVFLGMGSLQNTRREGRRASATQLAALQTIISVLGKERMDVVLQDPQFTELDEQFLGSFGYKVVQDPEAFRQVNEGTLVYAIHCYIDVYKTVSEGTRPACLIGTDFGNFGRFES